MIEDWRLMNCLNFVYLPEGFSSREEMDALYNWHVKRFYDSKGYHRRFAKRLWRIGESLACSETSSRNDCRRSYFSSNKEQLEKAKREFKLHHAATLGLNLI